MDDRDYVIESMKKNKVPPEAQERILKFWDSTDEEGRKNVVEFYKINGPEKVRQTLLEFTTGIPTADRLQKQWEIE